MARSTFRQLVFCTSTAPTIISKGDVAGPPVLRAQRRPTAADRLLAERTLMVDFLAGIFSPSASEDCALPTTDIRTSLCELWPGHAAEAQSTRSSRTSYIVATWPRNGMDFACRPPEHANLGPGGETMGAVAAATGQPDLHHPAVGALRDGRDPAAGIGRPQRGRRLDAAMARSAGLRAIFSPARADRLHPAGLAPRLAAAVAGLAARSWPAWPASACSWPSACGSACSSKALLMQAISAPAAEHRRHAGNRAVYLGAGIYEELLFRLILLTLGIGLLAGCGRARGQRDGRDPAEQLVFRRRPLRRPVRRRFAGSRSSSASWPACSSRCVPAIAASASPPARMPATTVLVGLSTLRAA